MKFEITCTLEHLEKAKQAIQLGKSRAENCWIAMACRDVFPNCVVTGKLEIKKPKSHFINLIQIEIPAQAKTAMTAFDQFFSTGNEPTPKTWKPLTFEIEISSAEIDDINQCYGYSIESLLKIINESPQYQLTAV